MTTSDGTAPADLPPPRGGGPGRSAAGWLGPSFATPADPPPARPPLSGRALFGVWFACVTVAEVIGFVLPALAGALTADAAPGVALPALLVTGAVEGAALGFGQGVVLRAAVPGLPVRRWTAATAAGAVVAYLLGMLPSTTASTILTWPPAVLVVLGTAAGLLLLASIGTAQWLVLRHRVPRSASWIATTAVAWLGGLGVFLAVAMPLWQPGQPLAQVVAVGAFAGLLMAATMAAVTGAGLVRLLAHRT